MSHHGYDQSISFTHCARPENRSEPVAVAWTSENLRQLGFPDPFDAAGADVVRVTIETGRDAVVNRTRKSHQSERRSYPDGAQSLRAAPPEQEHRVRNNESDERTAREGHHQC